MFDGPRAPKAQRSLSQVPQGGPTKPSDSSRPDDSDRDLSQSQGCAATVFATSATRMQGGAAGTLAGMVGGVRRVLPGALRREPASDAPEGRDAARTLPAPRRPAPATKGGRW